MHSVEGTAWQLSKEATDLRSLMESALENVTPDENYSIKANLNGVLPHADLVESLGDRFGLELDPTIGSKIELSRSRTSGRLVLNRLSMPLVERSNLHGSIHVQGVSLGDSSEYIPYVNLYNLTTQARRETWHRGWRKGLSRAILEGHNIDLMPDNTDQNYRLWFGQNVLSKAKSWHLLERRELGYPAPLQAHTKLAVAREQSMPEIAHDGYHALSVIHTSADLTDSENPAINQTTLSYIEEKDVRNIIHVSTTSSKQPTGRLAGSDRYRTYTEEDVALYKSLLSQTNRLN